MTEVEKLDFGLEYSFFDDEVNKRKQFAIAECEKLHKIPQTDEEAIAQQLIHRFGKADTNPWVGPNFWCDNGKNIFVGKDFIANYNVTILDIGKVTIGNNVWIGPNTLITTVGHPISPEGRKKHLAFQKPITIGNNVWIGGNVAILPGITIGDNSVVGAGAVVTKDVPADCVVAGVPAKIVRKIEEK